MVMLFSILVCLLGLGATIYTCLIERKCMHNKKMYEKFKETSKAAAMDEYGDEWEDHITKKYYNILINDIRLQSLVSVSRLMYYNDYHNTEICNDYIKVNGDYWIPTDEIALSNLFSFILKEISQKIIAHIS